MSYDVLDLIVSLLSVALVTISASLHEFGHAQAAHLCGDDTAKEQGRLTANPLAHIDPMGSVVLPLMLTLAGAGYIAYAKPVPYNPRRLKNRRRDEVIVALAGPAANIAQALVGAVLFRLAVLALYGGVRANPFAFPYYIYDISENPANFPAWICFLLFIYVRVNCSLAFFNLLPLPPLDGSKIVMPFLKGEALQRYYQIQRYALPVTLALVWLLPRYTGLDPVGAWLGLTAGNFGNLLVGAW